jgi:hypothetical protein
MNEQDLINAVRNHALQTYESDGWDYVVECWSDGDILECLRRRRDRSHKQSPMSAKHLAPLAERRDEVRAAGGEW